MWSCVFSVQSLTGSQTGKVHVSGTGGSRTVGRTAWPDRCCSCSRRTRCSRTCRWAGTWSWDRASSEKSKWQMTPRCLKHDRKKKHEKHLPSFWFTWLWGDVRWMWRRDPGSKKNQKKRKKRKRKSVGVRSVTCGELWGHRRWCRPPAVTCHLGCWLLPGCWCWSVHAWQDV